MDKFIIPEDHLNKIKKLLKDVTELLRKKGILYFADGGTLLGSVREKNQIPYDDDADIGVLCTCGESDKCAFHDGLPKLFPKFEKMGYFIQCQAQDELIKIYRPNEYILREDGESLIGTPTLDIFPWKCFLDEKFNDVTMILPKHYQQWPNCWHKTKDVFPLSERDFGNFKVCIPRNPFPYLDRMYPDWRHKKVIDLRNPDNTKSKSVEF